MLSAVPGARAGDGATRLNCPLASLDPPAPSTHQQGPVVVRGLDRHLEQRQLAERQRAEAEQRAAKVFWQRPAARVGATVPQPFQLAGHSLLEVRRRGEDGGLLLLLLPHRARSLRQPGCGGGRVN